MFCDSAFVLLSPIAKRISKDTKISMTTMAIAMLACAAGGLMVFHGNNDFFWVTATTSEMDTSVAYKTIPLISVLQSAVALFTVFILSLIFL